jgi:hypothetical protein
VNLPASTKSYAMQDVESQELLTEGTLSPLAQELLRQAGGVM